MSETALTIHVHREAIASAFISSRLITEDREFIRRAVVSKGTKWVELVRSERLLTLLRIDATPGNAEPAKTREAAE